MRKEIEVTAVDVDGCDRTFPPRGATEFLRWVTDHLATIPSEYRDSASVIVSSVGDYDGGHNPNVRIVYNRPETDAEMVAREVKEARVREDLKARELQQLAALKAKYGQ